jgi:predicted ferric reductase
MKKVLIYFLFLANLCFLIWTWWHFSGNLFLAPSLGAKFLTIGRLAGLVATNLILMQLILIGRVKWVESVFGLDRLSRAHKWNGYTILGLIVAHPILIVLGHSILHETGFLSQFAELIAFWDEILKAFIGWLILLATIGLSITIVRKRLAYETWYYVHIFNYLAILLIFGHQLNFGSDGQTSWYVAYWWALYIFAFGNLIFFRFLRPIYRFGKHQFRVARIVPDPAGATSIYITGKGLDKFKIEPGQFMIFRFLAKGFWWQAHPFSLSKPADGKEIRLTAKKLGDFTNALPNLPVGTPVIIDGPHGIFTASASRVAKAVLIAGGSGITPLRSLAEQFSREGRDFALIYGNKTSKDIMLKEELDTLSSQFGFPIHHVLSDEELPGYSHGYITKDIIQKLVPDIAERDVYLCGPPAMASAIRKAVAELGVPKKLVHFEKFALG